jgi:uncharacterized coiled-coil protein SlyX
MIKPTETVNYCLDELYKVNEWYRGTAKKDPSILALTSAKIRVVTLLTTLSTFVAEAKGDMKEQEAQYEFMFNKLNLAHLADSTIPEAKAKTIIDMKDMKDKFLTAYKYFTSLDYFYNKMSSVAESMVQDIASIKAEKSQTQRS